jgi:tripartite-type tricarboxylate transporter receptor subunit TctC
VQWYAVLAPAQTPRNIIAKLHTELVQVLHSPEIKKRFAADAAETVGNTPEEFARHIRSELDKWEKVAREAGIQPE